MTAPCPTPDVLDAFASGALEDHAVRAHVESCDACRAGVERLREDNTLLGRLARAMAAPPPTPARPAPRAEVREGLIPGYLLKEELHRGGQGVVYRAVQVATNRPVAIKMLLAGALATGRQRRRFEREIEVVAALRHPGIVTVYESGATADGRVYLAMELIDGQPLDRALPGAPGDARAVRQRLALMARVCEAVQYAHQRGVIHRDLKPGNILVDREGQPHVVDFGLAKGAGERADLAAVTRSGEFLGTIAYASPEQVSGSPEGVGTPSDVYALGVILYELLTGALPSPVDGPLAETVRHITQGQPRPPWALNRAVDGEVATIVLKALSKEPARRYTSARALGADLEAYLAGHAIDAKRDSTMYVLRKAFRRHRWAVGAGALALATLVGFAATMTVMYRQKTAAEERARRRAETARAAEAILVDAIASVDPSYAMAAPTADRDAGPEEGMVRGWFAGGELTMRTYLDLLSDYAAQRLASPGEEDLAAAVHRALGRSYVGLGQAERGVEHAARAVALQEETGETDPGSLARARTALAQGLAALGRAGEGLPHAERAVAEARRGGAEGRALPEALWALAACRRGLGDLDGAEAPFLEAARLAAAPPLRDDDLHVRLVRDHAQTLLHWGRMSRAREVLEEAAAGLRARGVKGSALAALLVEMAVPSPDAAPRPDRRALLDEALALCEADGTVAGQATLAAALVAKADLLMNSALRRALPEQLPPEVLGEAADLVERSIEVRARVFGPAHPRWAEGLMARSRVRMRQRRPAEADADIRAAIAVLERSPGGSEALIGAAYLTRSQVAFQQRRFDDTLDDAARAIEWFSRRGGVEAVPRPALWDAGMKLLTLTSLAPGAREEMARRGEQARWMSRDLAAEAEPLLQRCVEMDERGSEVAPWRKRYARAALARARVLLGRAGAGEELRRAHEELRADPEAPRPRVEQVREWADALPREGTPAPRGEGGGGPG